MDTDSWTERREGAFEDARRNCGPPHMHRLETLKLVWAALKVTDEANELRWDQRGSVCPTALDQPGEAFWIKATSEHDSRAGENVGKYLDLCNGPHRADVEKDLIRIDRRSLNDVLCSRHQVTVPEHDRLWRACRATT